MRRFDKLASPIKIGNLTLKNRMMTTSMSPGHGYTTEDGKPTQRFLNYLEERAAGQTALICQTVAPFRRIAKPPVHPLPIGCCEEDIPFLKQMADAVHKYEGLLVGQPWFVFNWKPDVQEEERAWGPSEISIRPGKHSSFKTMEKEQIEIFKKQYVNCALIIQRAGWDGVEVMAGVGGILNRFLSPSTNNRTDEYGGSLENRVRLTVEVIQAVREAVGPNFLITVRWSPLEYVKSPIGEGHGIKESLQVVPYLEEAGIDLHNLAIGWHESSVPLTIKDVPDGHWSWVSEQIKTVAKKPVAVGYRNTDPYVMEDILQKNKADIIAGLRYNIADPAFAKKIMEDRPEDVRLCICCCRCLDDVLTLGKSLNYCGVNPRLGGELDKPLYQRAKTPKEVMVVGAGVSGLRAAVTAYNSGHSVTLYERGPRVGGCLVMSSIFNPLYERLLNHYKALLKKHPGIKLRLNTGVTKDLVEREKPDAVIVAVGGEAKSLDVPGSDGGNVVQSHDFLELLNGKAPKKPGLINKIMWPFGSVFLRLYYTPSFARFFTAKSPWPMSKRIAVIGGGLPGCELGTFLMENNRRLTILEERKKIGFDVGGSERFHVTSAFKRADNVQLEPLTTVKAVDKNGVTATRADGSEFHVDAGTVVVTLGFDENMSLAKELEGLTRVYAVGDCNTPARMADATKGGHQAAAALGE